MIEGPTFWNGTYVYGRARSAPAAASSAPTSAAEVPGAGQRLPAGGGAGALVHVPAGAHVPFVAAGLPVLEALGVQPDGGDLGRGQAVLQGHRGTSVNAVCSNWCSREVRTSLTSSAASWVVQPKKVSRTSTPLLSSPSSSTSRW